MRFYRAFSFGVLLLSALLGKGVFHINGSYDLDLDGNSETLVLNSQGVSAMIVEVTSPSKSDTVWKYIAPKGVEIIDGEILDINNDGSLELVLIPTLLALSESEPWLYIFSYNQGSFSVEPVSYKEPLSELNVTRPTNLTIIPGEPSRIGVCFGSPIRKGVVFNIELFNNEIKIQNPKILSSPIFNNGYGVLQIGGFKSEGKNLVSILSMENNGLKTAIFDVDEDFKLINSKIIDIEEFKPIISFSVESYQSIDPSKNGLLLPFRSGNIHLLHLQKGIPSLVKTNLKSTEVYPSNNQSLSLDIILKKRKSLNVWELESSFNDPLFSQVDHEFPPNSDGELDENYILNARKNRLKSDSHLNKSESDNITKSEKDYSMLSPTLGDFLINVKKELNDPPSQKTKITVPEKNVDMRSVNWADEAGFLQMNLGEYIAEDTDTVEIKDPIPSIDLELTNFSSEAKKALSNNLDSFNDTIDLDSGLDQIDLYYVMAMTPASNTKDRYVFDGEAPFGVAVNQVPLTGKATHFQHGISANLSTLQIGETFDFGYSLRDIKSDLDSITTLKMIHDMQTDIVLMSISPSDDSISQSYQPESFDPQLYEFPNYFFDGFPNSLDMDFKDKLIRFSFNEVADSVYHGLYLSSTTPSFPPQSLAVFVDEGILQAIRGEIIVRPNGSKKVTTEFDLIGSVKPSVMFSKLIKENFSEELKEKLLQGASLEEPLFGPKGKLPKITQEPRLPDVEPSQPEHDIPVELNKNNVLESNIKNDSLLIESADVKNNQLLVPNTQKDELLPLELDNKRKENLFNSDSLMLEERKSKKNVIDSIHTPKSDELNFKEKNKFY